MGRKRSKSTSTEVDFMENDSVESYGQELERNTESILSRAKKLGISASEALPKWGSVYKYKITEDSTEPIVGSMCDYMVKNYDKIVGWMSHLTYSRINQSRGALLGFEADADDIVHETFVKVYRTFENNEKRLPVCQACKHQCRAFKEKTKKTNTEKYESKEKCIPYMYYSYSEKAFHNYINCSFTQNINCKILKMLDNKTKKRTTTSLDAAVNSDDASSPAQIDFISDKGVFQKDTSKELMENLLNKKLIFTHKLANFSLLPDVYDVKPEILTVENPDYNEEKEQAKAEQRELRLNSGEPITEDLKPIPPTKDYVIGVPEADIILELWKRFDFIPTYNESDEFWEKCLQSFIDRDIVRIGTTLDEFKETYGNEFNIPANKEFIDMIPLDEVLTDDDIKAFAIANGDEERIDDLRYKNRKHGKSVGSFDEEFEAMREEVMMDMMTALPDYYDLQDDDNFIAYKKYLRDYDYEEEPEMVYNDKTTTIELVDSDKQIIPLPLCVYAEVSVKDFLELCADIKEDSEFKANVLMNSNYTTSFKEFHITFEGKQYSIEEDYSFNQAGDKGIRLKMNMISKKLDKINKRLKNNYTSEELKSIITAMTDFSTPLDKFSPKFMKKVLGVIEDYALSHDCGKFIKSTKIKMPILKRIKLTQEERTARADEEFSRIVELRKKLLANEVRDINIAEEDVSVPNLKSQELYQSILDKIPTLESKYVLSEVKVLCTERDNQEIAVSA